MRRKVLVVAILIFAMLLQCFMPFTTVKAASSVVITLNSKLYAAVKKDLQKQKITADYQDASGTIIIPDTELSKVTKLDLSEAGIDDLEGLENFSSVSELDLHSNNLTVDSKLDVLDSLDLTNLDLSSNKLESVNTIASFDEIDQTDITNQKVVGRKIITVDVSEEAANQDELFEVELPDILLEDCGYIKPDWIKKVILKHEENGPDIDFETLDGNTLKLKVGKLDGSKYNARKGLIMVEIKVDDKESKLNETEMTFYFAVVDQDETGIAFNDEKLYKAVKDQLTQDQEINDDLTATQSDDIYSRTYDDALIMVIDSDTVLNDIPTLILNNKKIEDLTGIEEFFGLRSYLNLSFNYIDRIDKIVELEENKKVKEELIKGKYKEVLAKLKENVGLYDVEEKKIKEATEKWEKLKEELAALKKDDADQNKNNEKITAKTQEIQEQLNIISEAEKKEKEYLNLINNSLAKLYKIYKNEYRLVTLLPASVNLLSYEDLMKSNKEDVKKYAESIMDRVSQLEKNESLTDYEVFAIYKLMGDWGKENNLTFETQKDEYKAEGNTEGSGTPPTGTKVNIEYPISEYFDKVKQSETLDISDYKEFVYIFKAIDSLSQVEQYSLIKRIFEGDKSETDLAEEALEEIIEFLEQEDRDTYFYNMINYQDYSSQEDEKGKVFGNEGKKDGKGYVFDNKGDVFEIKIGLGESMYKGTIQDGAKTETSARIDLAHRLSIVTDEDINAYIVIPRIQNLNLRNNKIEKIDGLETFEQLKVLNLFKNEINDISGIDWEGFAKLRALSVGYNQISNIDPLEVIDTLEVLDVSYNLLAGRFNFNMTNMRNLWAADFSHNQYTDIQYANDQFILRARNYDADEDGFGDDLTVPEYLQEAGIYLSFQYQSVSLQATIVKTDEQFVYLELPLIFRQLADIDYDHTSFGIDSPNGLVVADGKQVKLPVGGEGQYTCRVTVEGYNGYEYRVEKGVSIPEFALGELPGLGTGSYSYDGMGYGTTCYITYNVVNSSIIPDDPDNPTNPNTPGQPTGYGFDVVNGDIAVYTPDLSVTAFTNKLIKSGQYKATVTNNNGNGKIATGAKVTVTSSDGKTKYDEFDVVVKGDINGDGKVDRLDSTVIKKAISDVEKLDGVYNSAADVNDDGKINSLDSMLILKYRADRIADFKQQ